MFSKRSFAEGLNQTKLLEVFFIPSEKPEDRKEVLKSGFRHHGSWSPVEGLSFGSFAGSGQVLFLPMRGPRARCPRMRALSRVVGGLGGAHPTVSPPAHPRSSCPALVRCRVAARPLSVFSHPPPPGLAGLLDPPDAVAPCVASLQRRRLREL